MPVPSFARMVHGVLTPAEAAELVSSINKKGFLPALLNVGHGVQEYDPSYRTGSRCIVDSPLLAKYLFSVISPHIPSEFYQGTSAEMRLDELNERCRFLCYSPGEEFAPHCDGCYFRPEGHAKWGSRSIVTVQLYLNDVAAVNGGATTFIGGDRSIAVQPRCGSCLVFTQELYHAGSKLLGGLKYTMRTEAMYSKPARHRRNPAVELTRFIGPPQQSEQQSEELSTSDRDTSTSRQDTSTSDQDMSISEWDVSTSDPHPSTLGADLPASGCVADDGQRSAGRSARHVHFGTVKTLSHEMTLSQSSCPSDGLAPVGLGKLLGIEHERLDDFEKQRTGRSPQLMPTAQRRLLLAGNEELVAVEAENKAIIAVSANEVFFPTDVVDAPGEYSTAAEDERTGRAGGFSEIDETQAESRKKRVLEARHATETRKAQRRRCSDCRRFSCICV